MSQTGPWDTMGFDTKNGEVIDCFMDFYGF